MHEFELQIASVQQLITSASSLCGPRKVHLSGSVYFVVKLPNYKLKSPNIYSLSRGTVLDVDELFNLRASVGDKIQVSLYRQRSFRSSQLLGSTTFIFQLPDADLLDLPLVGSNGEQVGQISMYKWADLFEDTTTQSPRSNISLTQTLP